MTGKTRIPITAITIFGISLLLLITVGISLYLGFNQAAETTRRLWADESETLINSLEQSLSSSLRPVREQARWIAAEVKDLSRPREFDSFVFGSLAATPQVEGIAFISIDGHSRRWHRDMDTPIEEDWSTKPWFEEYLQQVKETNGPAWRAPIFTATIGGTTLLHDIPLKNKQNEFIGVLAQIITIEDLSRMLSKTYSDTGVTPFVLYNHEYVLAHPAIEQGDASQPLVRLDELGDLVLAKIWSPDEGADFISEVLSDTEAGGILWGDDYYLILHRDINRFGPAPWTIGAYLNTTLRSNDDIERLIDALLVGLAVLVLAIGAAIIAGRKVSHPIKAIAQAADSIDRGNLNSIDQLKGSHIRELNDASHAFNNMVKGLQEREIMRDTLGRYVPEKVAAKLLASSGNIEVQQSEATILFCDIEAFTRLTEELGAVPIVKVLNAYFSAMVDILEAHDGVVTQFQGDAILATFNVPVADAKHAEHAVDSALEMLNCVEQQTFEGQKLGIRIGINTGQIVAGAIGAEGRLNYTVHGDAVNLAARLESMNKDYGTRLMISASSVAQIPNREFKSIGSFEVRGQSNQIEVYTLESGPASA